MLVVMFRRLLCSGMQKIMFTNWPDPHLQDAAKFPSPTQWNIARGIATLCNGCPAQNRPTDGPRLLWHWPLRVGRCGGLGVGEVFENKI